MCLDLPGADTTNGSPVWLWECNGMQSQQWDFRPDSLSISFAGDETKCVDVPGQEYSDGNKLWIWDCNGQESQKFGFNSDDNTIYVAADDVQAPVCLDVPGGD